MKISSIPLAVIAVAVSFLVGPSVSAQSVISLQKTTNGSHYTAAPGALVAVGSTVTWAYKVTNNTGRDVTSLAVSDSQIGAVSCPQTTIGAGLSVTCTATGTATAGQYSNVGTATVQDATGAQQTAEDTSWYYGYVPNVLTLQKSTNGVDADTAPGPVVPIGSPVSWTYLVTNTGSDTVSNISVADDQGVAVTCPLTSLDPGAQMTCTASGTAQAGQYSNLGSVTGTIPSGAQVGASDPSHYYGSALTIQKLTDGFDANTAPGPSLPVGSTVNWTYVVTNSGPDLLSNVSVTDDQGVSVSCPSTTIDSLVSMICTASGTVAPGQYGNVGTVTATDSRNVLLTASDPSHYYGATLTIQKSTNGEDAKTAPGPSLVVGGAVHWTYLVTYTGLDTLSSISVTDDQGVSVSCPSTTLASGASMTCTASGTVLAGQYANVGTVTGTNSSNVTFAASDPSHYFGQWVTEVPTLAISGFVLLTLLLAGFGIWRLRGRF